MSTEIIYFDMAHAIKVHDWIIENSGGMAGTNDLGLLRIPAKMNTHSGGR